MSRPVALTIAGSDSSGGAGVVADLKTFEALGVWGTVALTAVTAQNSLGVVASHLVPPALIRAQIGAVAGDLGVDAAKTGMLGSADGVRAAAEGIRSARITRVVVDPVLISKHGDPLLAEDAWAVVRAELLPLATVVTPNLPEAAALAGMAVEDRDAMVAAAEVLRRLGAQVVLVKGGHLADDESSPDLVCGADGVQWLEGRRLPMVHTHGTGCVLSAAIAAFLARGRSPRDACDQAKRFVAAAIEGAGPLGRGIGPIDPGGGGRKR
ncbi:MAG: bifunctional hydroxymethylpyrimidine kinase/phosphomethylpyrimidine kinase [Actinomycetota bacterium]|nr:bifunctional hydroxymethylpyrimidine kinase/phosphomethylpyrimidine kinase [Actinomycetota bacterium]